MDNVMPCGYPIERSVKKCGSKREPRVSRTQKLTNGKRWMRGPRTKFVQYFGQCGKIGLVLMCTPSVLSLVHEIISD